MEEKLLDFFKTFADANRLRIGAILLDQALPVEEISQRLNLRPTEVTRHLAQLEKLELLTKEADCYRLDAKDLERISREVLANHRPVAEAHSNDVNAADFDRKVVKNYSLPDGRLRELPGQDKKLQAILRHVVQVFEPGMRYTEKQVNEYLARFYEDTASLRRALVDHRLIQRETNGAVYWRAKQEE